MDLMYLPDAIAYPSLRPASSNSYFNYEPDEPLWTKQQPVTGKSPSQLQQSAPQTGDSRTQDKRTGHGGGNCPMCKERQRRRLATYIRRKSRQNSECAIEEEQELEEDGGKNDNKEPVLQPKP